MSPAAWCCIRSRRPQKSTCLISLLLCTICCFNTQAASKAICSKKSILNLQHHFNIMQTKHLLFALCAFFIGAASGCSQDSATTPPAITSEAYEPCCGAESVDQSWGNGRIYVPNVFTPNADGVNDFFVPSINGGIGYIDAYLIYTPVGDTVLFHRPGFDFNNVENYAWNGVRLDNGEVHRGLFRYAITCYIPATDGQYVFYEFKGSACSIVCDPEAAIFQTKTGCYFPEQASTSGGAVDATLPNNEKGCFE